MYVKNNLKYLIYFFLLSMLLKYRCIILFLCIFRNNILVHLIKMNKIHIQWNDKMINSYNKTLLLNSLRKTKNNIFYATYIKTPFLHINQRKINYLKKDNHSIYSKYYNNEPVYNTYNPILNYDILDIIKVYGRLAEHSKYESLNINININEQDVQVKENNNLFTKIFSFLKSKSTNDYNKVYWFHHFLKCGKMNFNDFRNSLFKLKFKWPKDSIFPTYNIFLFEKGLNKNMDSPTIRKKVENYMQYQEINDNLLKSCFYCFSNGKEYITVYDILRTFNNWKKISKHKNNDKPKGLFSFFKKEHNEEDESVDWFTFKKKIDLSTIQMYESKK